MLLFFPILDHGFNVLYYVLISLFRTNVPIYHVVLSCLETWSAEGGFLLVRLGRVRRLIASHIVLSR